MTKKVIERWSYSRWSKYHDCPAMYEWDYLLYPGKKISSPAMDRGLAIHKKAEFFVNGQITGMPNELKNFATEFKNLRREYKRGNGLTEPDISMNRDKSSSNGKDSDWFIGFADYEHKAEEMTVIDYKTGRKYPSHQDQGHAYSTALLCMNPDIDRITVEFWYLDIKDPDKNVREFNYKQSDLKRMFSLWERRIDVMYNDKVFEKTPYQWCKSCNRNKKNGGDCTRG